MTNSLRALQKRIARILDQMDDDSIDREGMVRLAKAIREVELEELPDRDFSYEDIDEETGNVVVTPKTPVISGSR